VTESHGGAIAFRGPATAAEVAAVIAVLHAPSPEDAPLSRYERWRRARIEALARSRRETR